MAQKPKKTLEQFTQDYVLWLTEKLITHGDNYFHYIPNSDMFGWGVAKGHLKFPPRPMKYEVPSGQLINKQGRYVYTENDVPDTVCISRAGKEYLELKHG